MRDNRGKTTLTLKRRNDDPMQELDRLQDRLVAKNVRKVRDNKHPHASTSGEG